MQTQVSIKKLGIVMASIIFAVACAIGGVAVANSAWSHAADANTVLYTRDTAPNTATIITVAGASESINADEVTLEGSSNLFTPRDTDTEIGKMMVLVNPVDVADKTKPRPSGNGILISFEPYENGDGSQTVMYSPVNKNFYRADTTVDIAEEAIMYPLQVIDATTVPQDWKDAVASIAYDIETGILTLPDVDRLYNNDITIYNFIKNEQKNTNRVFYGTLFLDDDGDATYDPEPYEIPNKSSLSVKDPSDKDTTWTAYRMGAERIEEGGSDSDQVSIVNTALHKMPVNGGDGCYLGYKSKDLRVFSVAFRKNGNVKSLVELEKGNDYTVGKDGTLAFSKGLNANNILVVSSIQKKDEVQKPILIGKTKNSLTFGTVTGYKYKLYKMEKNESTGKYEYKQVGDTKSTEGSSVTFSDLEESENGTKYYVEYIAPDGKSSGKKSFTTSKATEVESFKFKEGEVYSGWVSINSHYGGQIAIEGQRFDKGHTVFNCTLTNIYGDSEGAKQLREWFEGSNFKANCITPGTGYSDGRDKSCSVKVVEANQDTGDITLLVWTSGGWVNGGKYQNVAGNIRKQEDPKGRIAVQKKAMYPAISESLGEGGDQQHNDHYSLAGAVFELYGADGTKLDTLTTDEDGYAESEEVSIKLGPFTLKETERPKGYFALNDAITDIEVEANEVFTQDVEEEEERGAFEMWKTSTDEGSLDNPYYNFENIVYRLKGQEHGNEYYVTLNKDGYGKAIDRQTGRDDFIAYDTYTLEEYSTNAWYQKSDKKWDIVIDAETTERGTKPVQFGKDGEVADEPAYVWLELDKKTANPEITDHNSIYDLRGAKYEITCQTPLKSGHDTSNVNNWLPKASQGLSEPNIIETGVNKSTTPYTLSSDRLDGYGKSVKLLYGDYQVKEILDSNNFALDPVTYGIPHTKWGSDTNDVNGPFTSDKSGSTYHIIQTDRVSGTPTTDMADGDNNLKDNPDVDFTFKLNKKDDLNGSNLGEGKTDLSAIFEVRYYNVDDPSSTSVYDASKPFDVWYIKTDENGQAVFDDILERDANGNIVKSADGKYGVGKTYTGNRIEQEMGANTPRPYTYAQNPDNNGRIYIKKDSDGVEHAVIPVGIIEIEEVVAPYGYRYESGSLYGRDSGGVDENGRPYTPVDYTAPNAKPVIHKIYNTELNKGQDADWENGRFDTKRAEVSVSFPGGEVEEHIYRADIQIQKTRGDTSEPLSYIPFLITSKTTGEQHVIVTDENGFYTSENAATAAVNSRKGYDHSYNTNINDKLLAFNEQGNPYITDESKLKHEAGTYFFGYGPDKATDPVQGTDLASKDLYDDMMFDDAGQFITADGAFPYDDYVIEEIQVSKNEGLSLIKREFSISRDKYLVSPLPMTDTPVRIHTTATAENGSHVGAITGETVKITDEVQYEGLRVNAEYKMIGTLMNQATGEALVDANGDPFTVEKTWTTTDSEGTITLEFEVPAELVAGTATVVFEECWDGGTRVGYHTEITDQGQTVTFTQVHTTATDSVTGTHEGQTTQDVITVVDAVECKGLLVGKEYTVSGTLMNRETGKELQGPNGEKYTATNTFTADKPDMTVELRFDVPREVIAGKTVVAFEDLYNNGILVGQHADLNDEGQTVYYPALRTTATDSITKDHEGLAKDTVTINDLVEYENLIKGETYTISGKIMDKATGESLKGPDGKEFIASATFVAGKDDGLDSAKELVDAYLEVSKKVLDIYNNMSDDEKSAFMVSIGGTELPEFPPYEELKELIDQACKTGTTVLDEHKEMLENFDKFYLSLTDEQKKETTELVSVEKLYEAVKTVSAAAPADGEGEASEGAEKTPEHVSGSVIVSFEIPADVVRGKTTVVFENLYSGEEPNDENHKAKHEDLNDEGQTVVYPDIHTTATIDGAKIAPARDVITITDTIAYTNLTPGKKYTFTGKLMDKTTNDTVKNADGTDVTGQTVFTPETSDGTVDVTFTFDAMAIQFHDVVVFEEGYRTSDVADDLILVAEHKDINDADQTVRIDDAGLADDLIESGELPAAGDIILYSLVAIAFIAGCYACAYRHRKRNLFE